MVPSLLSRAAVLLSAWFIAAPLLSAAILADSTTDFSGTQGFRNWYYGYFPNGDPNSFTPLPYFNAQIQTWQQATCCPPFTQVGANSFSHPNGTNNGQEQWAVRRWQSTFSGPIIVSGRLSKVDITSTSTGVYGRVYLNHQQVAVTPLVTFENGVNYSVPLTVAVGDFIDFALAPNGPDNNDLSYLSATISSTANTIEVDFSKPLQVHSPSGFLFGIQVLPNGSPGSAPPQNTITPLNPVHWRTYTSPGWYQRVLAAAPNAAIDFITMNTYGLAIENYKGNAPPWLNFPGYEAIIQSLVAPLSPVSLNEYFEPWNEPDDGWSPYFPPGSPGYHYFWSGTAQQFFETYLHAFLAVRRALGPNAQLKGPDFAFYDRVTIQQFLEYCLANGCEVNALSWHALNDAAPDRAFITAKDARAAFFNNPRYAPLNMRRLDIDEMVGSHYILQPAGTLAFYQQFELGGADEGNRSCWPDPHTGADNCASGTLDGMLTQGTFQPRSVWYAHWAYADGVASRVQSAVSDPSIVALASSSGLSSGAPQILLGYVDYQTFIQNKAESRSFHLTLRHVDALSGMAGVASLKLRIERIPDTEESALAQLQAVAEIPVTVSGGTIDADLPAIALGDVHRISLYGGTPTGTPNYEGLWWASPAGSESGWGINFAHQGDTIFATWFTYDTSGKAWWLSMTATKSAPGVYGGTLYTTHGPAFSATPFDPMQVTRTAVGNATLTFTDANTTQFAYTVNGISQTKTLTREAFAVLPTCTFGAQPNLALATNYQDLWWAAPAGSESGWGINLTQQSNIIFGTWFTYDVDGTPLWLSVAATNTAPGVYTGTLYRTTGPAFNAVPFNPAGVTRTPVGTATFTFSDGATGTFAYTVNGLSQTKNITREVFVAPGTICQ